MSDAVAVAIITAVPLIVGMWLNYKATQRVATKVSEVNEYVQGNFHAEVAKGVALQGKLDDQNAEALAKSEAREGAVQPKEGA